MGVLDFLAFKRTATVHTATMPAERVLYRFQALESFESREFRSSYVEQGIYNVREGNDRLHKAVSAWEDEGKVRRL